MIIFRVRARELEEELANGWALVRELEKELADGWALACELEEELTDGWALVDFGFKLSPDGRMSRCVNLTKRFTCPRLRLHLALAFE